MSERDRSPRRGMCAAILSLESITLGLTSPVLVSIADVSVGVALGVGLGLALVCVLLAGLLRRPWAYWGGALVQVAAIALGVLIPLMFVLGIIFAVLWGMADLLGRRIEQDRAAAFAAYDAGPGRTDV